MRLLYIKDPLNVAAYKILATAAFGEIPLKCEGVYVDKNDDDVMSDVNHTTSTIHAVNIIDEERDNVELENANKDSEVNKKATRLHVNPTLLTTQLVLEKDNGTSCGVFEANAILRYIARADRQGLYHLYGRTPVEASQVDMWIDFASDEIDAANTPFLQHYCYTLKDHSDNDMPINNTNQIHYTDEQYSKALEELERVLAALDEILLTRTFLVGERMTIADIAVAFQIYLVYYCHYNYANRFVQTYKNVYRHYNTIMHNTRIYKMICNENLMLDFLTPSMAFSCSESRECYLPLPIASV